MSILSSCERSEAAYRRMRVQDNTVPKSELHPSIRFATQDAHAEPLEGLLDLTGEGFPPRCTSCWD